MKKFFILTLLTFSLSACKTYNEKDLQQFDVKIQHYLKNHHLEMERTNSGLYYHIEKEGEGEFIKFTDVVSFKYKGRLLDGTVFDEASKPVTFEIKQLIGAWKEMMLYLKPGGKAQLIAPPQLGYGDRDLDDIPPHSILIFDIEVVEVK